MTSHTMKAVALCATAILLSMNTPDRLRAQEGPGDGVYTSILTLWEDAPHKFETVVQGIPWKKLLGEKVNTRMGVKPFSDYFDVPEFEKEFAQRLAHKDGTTAYSISARRFFESESVSLAYYQAMLRELPGLLEKDDVEISEKDDHVIYTQRTGTDTRSVYVKYYPDEVKRGKKKQTRVYFSVRAAFVEEE